jgi:gamma-glutamylcyclotransferase
MPTRLDRLLAKAEKAEQTDFLYFAYGSNLDLAQIKARCPSARLVGAARLRGYALAFGGWSCRWGGSVATVLRAKGSAVPGQLFKLRFPCLRALDRFEGHPFAYERTAVVVRDSEGKQHKAFTYIQPADTFESWPPSAKYFTHIFEAYRHHQMDTDTLVRAATPRIFVYGSLLKGLTNHRLLVRARPLGKARTTRGYRMHDLGHFPAVVADAEGGRIVGELYEVDADTLTALDRLEGHPRLYRRTLVTLDDGTCAETYLMRAEQVHAADVVPSGDWRKHGGDR